MKHIRYLLFYVALLGLIALGSAGCGKIQTEILETSVVLNTDDTVGPYQVMAVVVSDQQPLKVQLVYSTDKFATDPQVAEMKQVSRDVFQGAIEGQQVGTTVEYYIRVIDSEETTATDPLKVPPHAEGLTYRFRVLP